jgi:hypothetical protein
MTLWDGRYYDKVVHPDHFKGTGWLGWRIRVFNWVRARLELHIQRLVVRWLSDRGSLPQEKRRAVLRTFDLDVQQEILENQRTSPIHEVEREELESPPDRSLRYSEGGQSSALNEAMEAAGAPPIRPQSMTDLIGAYGMPGRAKKYAKGRSKFVANPDGDFEPLEGDG